MSDIVQDGTPEHPYLLSVGDRPSPVLFTFTDGPTHDDAGVFIPVEDRARFDLSGWKAANVIPPRGAVTTLDDTMVTVFGDPVDGQAHIDPGEIIFTIKGTWRIVPVLANGPEPGPQYWRPGVHFWISDDGPNPFDP